MFRKLGRGVAGLALMLGLNGCTSDGGYDCDGGCLAKSELEREMQFLLSHVPEYDFRLKPINSSNYVIHIKQSHWVDPNDYEVGEVLLGNSELEFSEDEIEVFKSSIRSSLDAVVASQRMIQDVLFGLYAKGETNIYLEGLTENYSRDDAKIFCADILQSVIDLGLYEDTNLDNFVLLPGAGTINYAIGLCNSPELEGARVLNTTRRVLDKYGHGSVEFEAMQELREDYMLITFLKNGFENSIVILGGHHDLYNNLLDFYSTLGKMPGLIEIDCE